jgi:hypothetical protein
MPLQAVTLILACMGRPQQLAPWHAATQAAIARYMDMSGTPPVRTREVVTCNSYWCCTCWRLPCAPSPIAVCCIDAATHDTCSGPAAAVYDLNPQQLQPCQIYGCMAPHHPLLQWFRDTLACAQPCCWHHVMSGSAVTSTGAHKPAVSRA